MGRKPYASAVPPKVARERPLCDTDKNVVSCNVPARPSLPAGKRPSVGDSGMFFARAPVPPFQPPAALCNALFAGSSSLRSLCHSIYDNALLYLHFSSLSIAAQYKYRLISFGFFLESRKSYMYNYKVMLYISFRTVGSDPAHPLISNFQKEV